MPSRRRRSCASASNAAGIDGKVTAAAGTLTITAPGAAATALTAPGRFAIYDWERSVLGPDGRPAPTDAGGDGRAERRPGSSL